MQDPSMLLPEEASVPKSRKKKPSTQKASMFQQGHSVKGFQELLPPLPTQTPKKASKRGLKKEVSPLFQQPENSPSDSLPDSKASKRGLKKEVFPLFQQPENSPSDSLPDSSIPGNEYRALRRKYLLLEEESFGLGGELREVEDEVKTLEEEKLALLDELVVLEGLVDPSELQS